PHRHRLPAGRRADGGGGPRRGGGDPGRAAVAGAARAAPAARGPRRLPGLRRGAGGRPAARRAPPRPPRPRPPPPARRPPRPPPTLAAHSAAAPDAPDGAIDAAYADAVARLHALAVRGARAIDEPLVEPPDPADPLPEVQSSLGPEGYARAVEVAREHILAG